MRIPKHWVLGEHREQDPQGRAHRFVAWGSSLTSDEDAERDARQRAERLASAVINGRRPDPYEYLSDRPLKEPIIREMEEDGQVAAAITRNRYGAAVLNTADICFVDVDTPAGRAKGFFDAIKLIFRPKTATERFEAARQEQAERIRQWGELNGRALRLYQTARGLRVLMTDGRHDPTSPATLELFHEFGADHRYRQLTKAQECFRARLTPKPWRCGCERPPCSFPFVSHEQREKFDAWLAKYERKRREYATCRLVAEVGQPQDDAQLRLIVGLHDELSGVHTELPLA